jgi:hypothetical protein
VSKFTSIFIVNATTKASNHLICPDPELIRENGEVKRRERLGGLLNYLYRAAA